MCSCKIGEVHRRWDKRILFERTGFLCYDNGTELFCADNTKDR